VRLIKSAHSQRCKASTASLVVCDFELLQNVSCLTFRYPPSVRLSHAMAKNKAVVGDEETPDTVPVTVRKAGNIPVVTPALIDPTSSYRHEQLILGS